MGFLNDDFQKGLRLCLASLYEHEPDCAAIVVAFGPYSSEKKTRYVMTGTGAKKLRLAMRKLGPQKFELGTAAALATQLDDRFDKKIALVMHWYLVDHPPFHQVVDHILKKVAEEVPQYPNAAEDFYDLTVISEVIRSKNK